MFHCEQMTAYFRFYVGDDKDSLGLANTSLMGLLSAWRSHADDNAMYFPPPNSRELRRVRQAIKGAQLMFPWTTKRDTPITLAIIGMIASGLGTRCFYRRL